MALAAGTKLGPYEIIAPIGAGGMGEVYRALDTKLNRPVAVKLLSEELADAAAGRRFQREAQMASSLNHPHIVTVHDAGEIEGRQYLVTEYVDAGTLKDWATAPGSKAPRTWREIVELLVGVADALSTAHGAGILHRDIKPANILLTRSGYAKLADFGLAKLVEPPVPAEVAPDEATRTLPEKHTRPGVVVGTIAYMSPEQAAGKTLDARSDIFSFGIVLYQMLAGRRPFEGATDLETLQTIIHGTPQPLPADVPAALRGVVDKALEKDPAERYQSMREMVVDLRRLIRQSGETVAPSPPPRRRLWRAAVLILVMLVAGGVAIWFRTRQPIGFAQPQYTPLTNFADSATSPALSPDGRMLTFIRGASTFFGSGQIYVKLLPDGQPVQLTHDDLPKFGPAFSPDGTRIAYATGMLGPETMTMDTWVVPVLGGEPQRWLTNAEGLTWSVDRAGKSRVMFSELTGHGFQMSIVSSTESRNDQRTVYAPPADGMAHRSRPSPRGNQVIVIEMGFNSWLPCRLLPADGSSPGKPVGPAPAQCTDAGWSPDGKWMYFSADTGRGVHTWRQRFPDGKPEQVTFGATEEEGVVAPDGRSFVTSIGTSQSTLWVHDSKGDRQITSEGYSYWPSIAPDSKRLYYLVRTGGTESFIKGGLWVTNLETGQRQRLVSDFQMQRYNISSDGQRVVFAAVDENGHTPVWLASLNGQTQPRKLTAMDCWEAYFGAPGEVVFEGSDKRTPFIFRVKEDGNALEKIVQTPFLVSQGVSPDGRWVAAQDSSAWGALVLYPAGSGAPRRVCAACSIPQGTDPVPASMNWTPDGRFVYLRFATSTYAIPLQPSQILPPIPSSGFASKEAVAAVPGARLWPQRTCIPVLIPPSTHL